MCSDSNLEFLIESSGKSTTFPLYLSRQVFFGRPSVRPSVTYNGNVIADFALYGIEIPNDGEMTRTIIFFRLGREQPFSPLFLFCASLLVRYSWFPPNDVPASLFLPRGGSNTPIHGRDLPWRPSRTELMSDTVDTYDVVGDGPSHNLRSTFFDRPSSPLLLSSRFFRIQLDPHYSAHWPIDGGMWRVMK